MAPVLTILVSMAFAVTIQSTRSAQASEVDPDPAGTCFECKFGSCTEEQMFQVYSTDYVKRCLNFNPLDPPHCCDVWRKTYQSRPDSEGLFTLCRLYNCGNCYNPGNTCTTPPPTTPPT